MALHATGVSELSALAVVISGTAAAAGAYFTRRRVTRGQVGTSDAATLWAQSQEMRTQLLAEKAKAEDQRDRILAIQSDQVVPVLTSTSESLRQILAGFDALMASQSRMDAMLTQMHDKYIHPGSAGGH